jgi:hypothetical protein
MDDDNLIRRAYVAWFKTGGNQQPNRSGSGVVTLNGKHYVVLHGGMGGGNMPLAIYRVRTSGVLKRLVRYPVALNDLP